MVRLACTGLDASEYVPQMASRRDQITMAAAEVADYLESQRVLNVATIGPSGHPHVVAMWFVMLDGRPTFWTFAKSQKVQNLRRDKKITGLVESGETYETLRGVELVGSAVVIEDYDRVLDVGKRVGVKYNGEGALSEAALPFLEAQATKRVGIAIDVERVVSWDHTKLGSGY